MLKLRALQAIVPSSHVSINTMLAARETYILNAVGKGLSDVLAGYVFRQYVWKHRSVAVFVYRHETHPCLVQSILAKACSASLLDPRA